MRTAFTIARFVVDFFGIVFILGGAFLFFVAWASAKAEDARLEQGLDE